MKRLLFKLSLIIVLVCGSASQAGAMSFALDSIAAWGKFPKFCIDVYRWGDRFFNTYDTAYVVGSGYKFNGKITTDSWLDYYHFSIPGEGTAKIPVDLMSDPSTSVGAYLTYLAVSVGYDINISQIFRGVQQARSRYRFGFDCSLLGFEFYIENNDVNTKMRRFGDEKGLNLPFNAITRHTWGGDVYYFFNHKKYSQAAGFNFSRIQKKSNGSFYAGLSISSQNYNFDFSGIPDYLRDQLPHTWDNYQYKFKVRNYGLRLGYGYNWVFASHWLYAVSFSPRVGLRKGFVVNAEDEKMTFSFNSCLKMSVVWNNGRWFAGLVGKLDTALINDPSTTFMGNSMSLSTAVGYRFNLW